MSNYYTQGAAGAGAGGSYSPDDGRYPSPTDSRRPLQQQYSSSSYQYEDKSAQREQGFDVRADFDGEGPRWSEMYGVGKQETYRPVYDHDIDEPGQLGAPQPHRLQQPVHDPEMISIPVLGAEWTKDELHGQSKRGKTAAKREDRQTKVRAWNRDQRGCCGIQWMTRTVFVFIAFFFIIGLILTLYFCIPRTVAFKFYDSNIMSVNTDTLNFNRLPTNFSFDADLHLMADTSGSYLPVQFSNAEAKIFDGQTAKLIATGNLGKKTIAHGRNVPVKFPVTFSYSALNMTDETWFNMYNACKYPWPGQPRSGLNWRLEIKQSIIGMVTHPTIATSVLGSSCTFNISTAV